jgi:hypothetical protein
VLNEFTKKRWPAAKDFNSTWKKLEGGRRQVVRCKEVVAEEANAHVVIHMDVVLGKFLVDESPVEKLPKISSPTNNIRDSLRHRICRC